MSFKSDERRHQLRWKARTSALTPEARQPGTYTAADTGPRSDHFLHEDHAVENLLPSIRDEALDLFASIGAEWHDGPTPQLPSNYLMDSQVSCVNALLPLAHEPAALAALFAPLVPGATGAAEVEDGRCLTFEWNGLGNPLGERSPKRRRGAYGTSLDAYTILTTPTERVGLAIEWKYTEQYLRARPKPWGLRDYARWFTDPAGPLEGPPRTWITEPLYQLARSQCLCWRMEANHELDVDRVVFAVVVPDANRDYRGHTPAPLEGPDLLPAFAARLRRPDRFAETSLVRLLSTFDHPALDEVRARYVDGR